MFFVVLGVGMVKGGWSWEICSLVGGGGECNVLGLLSIGGILVVGVRFGVSWGREVGEERGWLKWIIEEWVDLLKGFGEWWEEV